jgi:hypothetical protein
MHARLDRGAVKLLTRTGLDWTHKYPAIAKAVAALDARQAYFDGELCGVGPDGITAFNIVQLASDSGNAAALVFPSPARHGPEKKAWRGRAQRQNPFAPKAAKSVFGALGEPAPVTVRRSPTTGVAAIGLPAAPAAGRRPGPAGHASGSRRI